jgi:CheY-like chemotaxis protein
MSRGLVLIVDDERDIQGFLTTLIGFFGYKAATADDGRQAIAVALQRKPDLILMDLAMPNLDGFKAIARLKADPATLDIPIIAFSGLYMTSPVRTRLIEAGCSDFLPKPIDTDALYTSMAMAMRGEKPKAPPEEDSPLKIDIDLNAEQQRSNIRRIIKFFKSDRKKT